MRTEPTAKAVTHYTPLAISLHWLMALLFFAGWGLGTYMHDLPLSPQKLRYFSWHKWMGVTVFLLALIRVAWLTTHRPPPLPPASPSWQVMTARANHILLYLLMLILPLSGWLMSSAKGVPTVYFGVLPIPDLIAKDKQLGENLEEVHEWLAYALAIFVLIHIGAALKHQFIDRDGLISRMLPRRGAVKS